MLTKNASKAQRQAFLREPEQFTFYMGLAFHNRKIHLVALDKSRDEVERLLKTKHPKASHFIYQSDELTGMQSAKIETWLMENGTPSNEASEIRVQIAHSIVNALDMAWQKQQRSKRGPRHIRR